MKDKLKRLIEGSPTQFFDAVRSRIEEKVSTSVENIAETVAPAVFEEVEQIDEAGFSAPLSPLVKGKKDSGYMRHGKGYAFSSSNPDMRINRRAGLDKKIGWDDDAAKEQQRQKNQEARIKRRLTKEEVEQLDELSRGTLASYTRKSAADMAGARGEAARYFGYKQREKNKTRKDIFQDFENTENNRIRKRWKGIQSATKKLAKEEIESIEEKQNTAMLGRYRLVDKEGNVLHSHDDKNQVIAKGKQLGGFPHVRMVDTDKQMHENIVRTLAYDGPNKIAAKVRDSYIAAKEKMFPGDTTEFDKREREAKAAKAAKAAKKVNEDMGAHTIYTHNRKSGKNVGTFVINKKRRSKADAQRSWTDLVRKNQPEETVWDKHIKGN